MPFRFELFDNTNTTRQGQLALIRDARAVFELEGENSLSFKVSIDDLRFSSVVERMYVRLVDDQDPTTYYSFIIRMIDTVIDRDGDIYYQLSCEGLKYSLMDYMIASTKEYFDITATQALTLITAAASGWSNGTIDPGSSNLATIKFDFMNCLEALQKLVDTWVYDDSGTQRHYYYQVNENKTIDIRTLSAIGTLRSFYIHIDKNMRQFRKASDTGGMANRVYGVGADGFSFERAQATDYQLEGLEETATGGDTGYIEDTNNIDTNDLYNGLRGIIVSGTGNGQKFTVDDTVAASSQIQPVVDFLTAPDATSVYRLGHAETGEDMTYDLGAYASDTDDALINSEIIVTFLMDAVDSSGSATFEVKVYALDSGDSTVIEGAYTEVFDDLSSENSKTAQIVLQIGDNTGIQKLKLECNSCNANGYVHFQEVLYSQGPNETYIDDSTSQSTYGIITGKYENPDIFDTINLVKTPAMDGTYSSGICEDWQDVGVGSPTFSENTTALYIHHGTKSQKIIASGGGEGIKQNLSLKANTAYSIYVRVYILSGGSLKVEFGDLLGASRSEAETSGTGWIELTIENSSFTSGFCYIAIVSAGGSTSNQQPTYFIDAVMVHEGAEIHPFVVGDSADLLYQETYNYLQDNKDPNVSYDLNLENLYEKDPGLYVNDNFDPGDRIRVVDPDLSLDSQLLVIRKEFNPLDPTECTVRLARKPDWHRRSLGRLILKTVRERRLI